MPYYKVIPECSFSFFSFYHFYLTFGLSKFLHDSYKYYPSIISSVFNFKRSCLYLLSILQLVSNQSSFHRFIFVSFIELDDLNTFSFELFAIIDFSFFFIIIVVLFSIDFQYASSFSHLKLWFVLFGLLWQNQQMKP